MFKAVGYFNIAKDNISGFLVPVFSKKDDVSKKEELYAAEINNYNELVDFKIVDLEDKPFIEKLTIHEKVNLNIGDNAIYFFKYDDEILYGTKKNLAINLAKNAKSILNLIDDFTKFDFYSFLGVTEKVEVFQQKIMKKYDVGIGEKLAIENDKKVPVQLFSNIKLILENRSYKNLMPKYKKGFLKEEGEVLYIGNGYTVKKAELNEYLESNAILDKIDDRYSIEAYIILKKQCNGSIKILEKTNIVSKHLLSSSVEIPSLYKHILYETVKLNPNEKKMIDSLASIPAKNNNRVSPVVLNAKFEKDYKIKSRKRKNIVSTIEQLEDIKNRVLTNNPFRYEK